MTWPRFVVHDVQLQHKVVAPMFRNTGKTPILQKRSNVDVVLLTIVPPYTQFALG